MIHFQTASRIYYKMIPKISQMYRMAKKLKKIRTRAHSYRSINSKHFVEKPVRFIQGTVRQSLENKLKRYTYWNTRGRLYGHFTYRPIIISLVRSTCEPSRYYYSLKTYDFDSSDYDNVWRLCLCLFARRKKHVLFFVCGMCVTDRTWQRSVFS